ncbi:MAG: hypothetical protein KJN95_02460 [Gammaproteobacteria bacterium]|nr:hypothetical protein [Gammaproteobacteria bacterium]MBT8437955.1 hypothetical protein [Gammaproteobacteria bacterium]
MNLIDWRLLIAGILALALSGCGEVDESDGDIRNTVALPTDDTIPLDLYCDDIGIFGEDCILDDPANPYATSPLSVELKFELDADAPSATARFYLWGTALAKGIGATGENQFYVALNLHRMWASSTSELTRLQALKAYRSYLDNFFNSTTFFEIPVDSGNFVPQSLNIFTGEMLFDPVDITNTFTSTRLFNPDMAINRFEAEIEVGIWGYFYDQNTEEFFPF